MRPRHANWVSVLRPGNEVEVAGITAKRRRCNLQQDPGAAAVEFGFRSNLANVASLFLTAISRGFVSISDSLSVSCMQSVGFQRGHQL